MSEKAARTAVSIFLSYSHKDRTRKDRVLEYLEPLQREGLATIWTDDRISLGAQWDEQIRKRIEQSQMAIVLVSMPFLNSPYCRTVEIAKFLELRSKGGLLIVPVILFECDWRSEPWLAQTQAFPGEDKTLFGTHTRPGALAKALQRHLDRLRDELKAFPSAPVVHKMFTSISPPPLTSANMSDDSELIAQLFARDPVINSAAADALIRRQFDAFDALATGLAQVQPLNVRSVRRVCAVNPQKSGPELVQCVMNAKSDWHRATGAADAFTVVHRRVSENVVARRLTDDLDLGRHRPQLHRSARADGRERMGARNPKVSDRGG